MRCSSLLVSTLEHVSDFSIALMLIEDKFEIIHVFESVGRSPRRKSGRKVRTPQSTVLANSQAGQPDGKCNRKHTAHSN